MIAMIALFIVVSIIIWSVSRAILWRLTINRKLSRKYILKSLLFALWFAAGTIVGIFVYISVKQSLAALGIYILFFVYFSNLLLLNYARKQKFFLKKFNYMLFINFIIRFISFWASNCNIYTSFCTSK